MQSFFTGWIGYGTSVQTGILQEPSDNSYSRAPIKFSALENGLAFDISGGTVGPASTSWGTLAFGGLFDAPNGGNLLVVFSMRLPTTVRTGATYTTGPGSNFIFSSTLRIGSATQSFPAGTPIGTSPDGRQFVAAIPLQVAEGTLSAQSLTFGSTVTMAVLPGQPPALGSGQLWNNGGMVAVA